MEDFVTMNIRLFKLYSLIRGFVPIYPVYLLLFESKGLSLGEISLLLAIWSAPVVLLELPTGILSDHWSRKNMLVIGDLLRAACYVCWFLSDGFLLFAIGFVLWGIGEAFFSGSLEALLFDSLKKDGQEGDFDKIYGRIDAYTLTTTAISMLIGGGLAMLLGMKTVLLFSAITSFIAALLASRLTEVNLFKSTHHKENAPDSSSLKQYFRTLGDAGAFFIKTPALLTLAFLAILGIGIVDIIDEYDQLIASEYGLNLALIGVWGGIRYFLEALGNRLAYRFKGLLSLTGIRNPFYAVCALCVFCSFLLGVAGLSGHTMAMPFYGLFYLISASARIIMEDTLQQKIEEQGRSTVHSMLSLAHNGFGVVLFSFFALILPKLGIFGVLTFTAAYLLVLSLILSFVYRRVTRTRSEVS
jgi:MFS family permease